MVDITDKDLKRSEHKIFGALNSCMEIIGAFHDEIFPGQTADESIATLIASINRYAGRMLIVAHSIDNGCEKPDIEAMSAELDLYTDKITKAMEEYSTEFKQREALRKGKVT
jgi:hypothetical protein